MVCRVGAISERRTVCIYMHTHSQELCCSPFGCTGILQVAPDQCHRSTIHSCCNLPPRLQATNSCTQICKSTYTDLCRIHCRAPALDPSPLVSPNRVHQRIPFITVHYVGDCRARLTARHGATYHHKGVCCRRHNGQWSTQRAMDVWHAAPHTRLTFDDGVLVNSSSQAANTAPGRGPVYTVSSCCRCPLHKEKQNTRDIGRNTSFVV